MQKRKRSPRARRNTTAWQPVWLMNRPIEHIDFGTAVHEAMDRMVVTDYASLERAIYAHYAEPLLDRIQYFVAARNMLLFTDPIDLTADMRAIYDDARQWLMDEKVALFTIAYGG